MTPTNEQRKKRLLWQIPLLAVLIIGTILIIREQQVMPYQENIGLVFGTEYHITYQCNDDLQPEIEAELKKVDNSLSTFNQQSVISKINRNEEMSVNEMFEQVFNKAQYVSQETDGAFDITVAPLVNLWGFGFKTGENPSKEKVDSLMQCIGYQTVSLNNKKVRKVHPNTMLDAAAIAKGYACDVIAQLFRDKGIKNFMVEIGGEVITCGNSPKRIPWKIGVTKPVDDSLNTQQEQQAVLNVTDMAMATSGNYRNFYYKGGKKYAHTIDPKTGYPVQHSLLSATVLAKDCATADAFATAFMVMGIEKAKKVLEKHSELMAYFIYSDAKGELAVWHSPSMDGKILEN
ncbi:MAG: FAD:protein FMN transferase [Prevotella sp.]|nr:FAD:protein FMN transferase [Prevotella sp.]